MGPTARLGTLELFPCRESKRDSSDVWQQPSAALHTDSSSHSIVKIWGDKQTINWKVCGINIEDGGTI